MSSVATCPTPKPFRIAQGVVRGGAVWWSNFQPPCDVLTCPACKANRMRVTAEHLLTVAAGERVLYLAKTGPDAGQAVKRGFDKVKGSREDSGRLNVTLESGNFHVANVDCFTRERRGRAEMQAVQAPVDKVILALRAPALPVTRSGRWIGAWRPRPDEDEGEQLFLLSHDAKGDMRRRFCAAYGFSEALFSGTHTMGLSDPKLWEIVAAIEWWRINEMGMAPRLYRGAVITPTPPIGFIFRDERRSSLVDMSRQ